MPKAIAASVSAALKAIIATPNCVESLDLTLEAIAANTIIMAPKAIAPFEASFQFVLPITLKATDAIAKAAPRAIIATLIALIVFILLVSISVAKANASITAEKPPAAATAVCQGTLAINDIE